MNDDEVRADGIVRTALQALPVPPHGDDFWIRLDRALDGEPALGPPTSAAPSVFVAEDEPTSEVRPVPAIATEAAPAHDPSLALVPPALRRPSNALLVAVAAAAIVAVALAGNALLDERSGRGADTLPNRSLATADLDALVEDAQPVDATTNTMSADAEATSSGAVLAWVEHLRAGAVDDAWAAMGPMSQANFGSQAAFEAQFAVLAEGYRSWSGVEPEQVLVTPVADRDGILAVVTVLSTVTLEGDRQQHAEAFAVRFLDGEAKVEPFASAGELEMVVPEAAPDGSTRPVVAGEELVVVVPGGVDPPLLRLDDGAAVVCGAAELTELVPLDDAPGQRCAYLPEGGISAGEHTLTVAFSSADGAEISAQAMLFDAA